jgi:hypothetical protein
MVPPARLDCLRPRDCLSCCVLAPNPDKARVREVPFEEQLVGRTTAELPDSLDKVVKLYPHQLGAEARGESSPRHAGVGGSRRSARRPSFADSSPQSLGRTTRADVLRRRCWRATHREANFRSAACRTRSTRSSLRSDSQVAAGGVPTRRSRPGHPRQEMMTVIRSHEIRRWLAQVCGFVA